MSALYESYVCYHKLAESHGQCGPILDQRCWGCAMLDQLGHSLPHERMNSDEIVTFVKESILAFNKPCYGGYSINDDHADERARNIAMVILVDRP